MKNKIKTYKVFYVVGIIGILNTVTKVMFPNFYDGNGLFTYICGLPLYAIGLLDYNTMWLPFLSLFDGAPLWLIVGYLLSKKQK